MKKINLFFITFFCFFILASCKDDKEEKIWDFTNYEIEFSIPENDSIVNSEEFLSHIKITYNGNIYTYSEKNNTNYLRATMPLPLAIRFYKANDSISHTNSIISFGEFSPTDNYKKEKFTIDWGTDRVDNIEFSLYITGGNNNPKINKILKYNGKVVEFAPILITN